MGKRPDQSQDTDSLNAALTRKAKLEADLLQEQLSPTSRRRETIKIAASASGLLLVLISLIGGLASVATWFHDQAQNRELRVEERLERTLNQLSDVRPAQRVAAVGSISSFLSPDADERNNRVVLAIANALALEDNPIVLNAMAGFFADLSPARLSRASLDRALATLNVHNRGMVAGTRLGLEGPRYDWRRFAETDPQGQRLHALVRATTSLMRLGARARDMSGLYLVRANLSGLDLSGAQFDNALLNWANFTHGTLRRASFDGANLSGTSFVAADLREAKFILTESSDSGIRRNSFVETSISWQPPEAGDAPSQARNGRPPIRIVRFPDFQCADLRGADFSGFPLWNLTAIEIRLQQPIFSRFSFAGANLAHADFSKLGVFAVRRGHSALPPIDFRSWSGINLGDGAFTLYRAAFNPDTRLVERSIAFTMAFSELRGAFRRSNLRETRLPSAMRTLLLSRPLLDGMPLTCSPRAPW